MTRNDNFLLCINNMTQQEIMSFIIDHLVGYGFEEEDIDSTYYRSFNKILKKLSNLPKIIDLYRIIEIPNIEHFKQKEIGHHYVLDFNTFKSDGFRVSVDISDSNENLYIIHAQVNKEEIDFESTIIQQLAYPNEKEITLYNEN